MRSFTDYTSSSTNVAPGYLQFIEGTDWDRDDRDDGGALVGASPRAPLPHLPGGLERELLVPA